MLKYTYENGCLWDSDTCTYAAWNGHLVVRCLAADPDALRTLAQRLLTAYRGQPLPRVWQA